MNKIILILLAVLNIVIFNEPGPVWMFSLFLVLIVFKEQILKIIHVKFKLSNKYVITGLIAGLIIEVLAIINSMKLAPADRALFHPDPIPDLILAVGYYVLLGIGSYILLRKNKFYVNEVFVLGGIFGLIVEQHGLVLLSVFAGNILGGIYVFLSYGAFLALPYLLYFNEFKGKRNSSKIMYVKTLLIWAVFYLAFLVYYVSVKAILAS